MKKLVTKLVQLILALLIVLTSVFMGPDFAAAEDFDDDRRRGKCALKYKSELIYDFGCAWTATDALEPFPLLYNLTNGEILYIGLRSYHWRFTDPTARCILKEDLEICHD